METVAHPEFHDVCRNLAKTSRRMLIETFARLSAAIGCRLQRIARSRGRLFRRRLHPAASTNAARSIPAHPPSSFEVHTIEQAPRQDHVPPAQAVPRPSLPGRSSTWRCDAFRNGPKGIEARSSEVGASPDCRARTSAARCCPDGPPRQTTWSQSGANCSILPIPHANQALDVADSRNDSATERALQDRLQETIRRPTRTGDVGLFGRLSAYRRVNLDNACRAFGLGFDCRKCGAFGGGVHSGFFVGESFSAFGGRTRGRFVLV